MNNGGWHFSNILTPYDIREKIKSFAHSEFNTPEFTNLENIKEIIRLKKIYLVENWDLGTNDTSGRLTQIYK
ncbi:hypothetical protein ABXT46_00210 [Candidatus Pelagibacter sp. Uisw_104]|uniref:hypothetical protein n=1 Tax=Candidatus Pelagibacter sp. Uisw_104 TaxID=3230983 RepID=UPI0039E8F631